MNRNVFLLGTHSDYVILQSFHICLLRLTKKKKNGGSTHLTKLGRLLLKSGSTDVEGFL